MDVAVEDVVMRAVADPRREVRPNLWRIRVDKMHAGFIERKGDGIPEGARAMMHLRYPEDELAEIEQKVSEHFQQDVGAVQPSEIPQQTNKEDDEILDDFE